MAKPRKRRPFGTVIEERSGRHAARYPDPDGRTRITRHGNAAPVLHYAPHTFDTEMDADAWLVAERRLILAETWTPPKERRRAALEAEESRRTNTFATYARAWLASRHDLRPTTRASYEGSLERHLIPAFGHLPLDGITVPQVRAWFAAYGDRTPTARAHAYQVLSAIFKAAEDDELIVRSPARVKAGGRTKPQREPEVLTWAELFALADAMPEHHRALTLICGTCALRFGEAVALRRRDIDLEAREVHVRRTATRAGGSKSVGPPKTGAGVRTVTMPRSIVPAVRGHLAALEVTGRDALVFPGHDGELLAPSALYGRIARTETRRGKGGRRLTYEKAAYGFFAAREAIGRPNLHWHDLRRTALTLAAQAGATTKELQNRAGHTTADMAMLYQVATAERDRAIADAMDHGETHGDVTELRRDAK